MTISDIVKLTLAVLIGGGTAFVLMQYLTPVPLPPPTPMPITSDAASCGTGADGIPLPCGGTHDSAEVGWYDNFTAIGPTEAEIFGLTSWKDTPSHLPLSVEEATTLNGCTLYDKPLNGAELLPQLPLGVIWLTYQPDVPEAAGQQLQQLATTETALIISPNSDQPTPFLVTADHVQLPLTTISDPRLAQFLAHYQADSCGLSSHQ